MNTSPQKAPPLPLIVRPGYRLTTLLSLPDARSRERFESYRASLGKAAYFHDAAYGSNLTTAQGFWLDAADIGEHERAFLLGADSQEVEGIRIPWHEKSGVALLRSDEAEFLRRYFESRGYTIWPDTHALVVIEHAYVRMLATILSAEQDPD